MYFVWVAYAPTMQKLNRLGNLGNDETSSKVGGLPMGFYFLGRAKHKLADADVWMGPGDCMFFFGNDTCS